MTDSESEYLLGLCFNKNIIIECDRYFSGVIGNLSEVAWAKQLISNCFKCHCAEDYSN